MREFLNEYGNVLFILILLYLAVISFISVVVTIFDKCRSKQPGKRRIPEKTLLLLSALGGSVAMLITMLMIRHKTHHMKFMIGIPIILLFQAVVLIYVSRLIG